jgi:alpha-tubulin suppressor-like RCC1 family protein
VGGAHACAIHQEGRVACWGSNPQGQLGLGYTSTSEPPRWVPDLRGVVQLAAGGAFTCARTDDGRVLCWGTNAEGELGDGSRLSRSSPQVVAPLPPASALAADGAQACALDLAGRLWCWGADLAVPFGSEEQGVHVRPTQIPLPFAARGLALGRRQVCAWSQEGQIACRGEWEIQVDVDGAARPGVVRVQETNPIQTIPGTVGLAFQEGRVCAIRGDGALVCWTYHGTLPVTRVESEPAVPDVDAGDVAQLATTWQLQLVRSRAGVLVRRGADAPEMEAPPGPITQVEVKGLACLRQAEGAIWCAGDDLDGVLGDGTISRASRAFRQVVPPDSIDAARWQALVADGRGDACTADSDCAWDDPAAPQRCRAAPPAPTGGPAVDAGPCICLEQRCTAHPFHPPPSVGTGCRREGCGLDQATGQCLVGRDLQGNASRRRPDGPLCRCDPASDQCRWEWRTPTPCQSNLDCWFGAEPGTLGPRPASLRHHRFRPCVDGEREPICDHGACSWGRPYGC